MEVFLVMFALFFIMMLLMSVGVFFKRKPISGSCGGLGAVGVNKACDCDKVCGDNLKQIEEPKAN